MNIQTIVQTATLSYLFLYRLNFVERPSLILIQNPPSIPSLLVACLLSTLADVKMAIDWHNYGYSIMKIQNQNRTIVKIAEIYEKLFAKLSNVNFTVTQKMAVVNRV